MKGIPLCQKLKQMCYTCYLVNTTHDCQGGPIMHVFSFNFPHVPHVLLLTISFYCNFNCIKK